MEIHKAPPLWTRTELVRHESYTRSGSRLELASGYRGLSSAAASQQHELHHHLTPHRHSTNHHLALLWAQIQILHFYICCSGLELDLGWGAEGGSWVTRMPRPVPRHFRLHRFSLRPGSFGSVNDDGNLVIKFHPSHTCTRHTGSVLFTPNLQDRQSPPARPFQFRQRLAPWVDMMVWLVAPNVKRERKKRTTNNRSSRTHSSPPVGNYFTCLGTTTEIVRFEFRLERHSFALISRAFPFSLQSPDICSFPR